VSQRKKMGFTFPMDHWLKNELSNMVDHRMQYLADRSEFNSDGVMRKWKNYKRGDKRILWSRIWKLVVLSDWLQRNQL
ncbi:MAG TPA: asparagine synthase-related protein, partial [Saprospiraceae bacterium]|nr:asparagine synthase-related protein [Saprospiraceae bacterium]